MLCKHLLNHRNRISLSKVTIRPKVYFKFQLIGLDCLMGEEIILKAEKLKAKRAKKNNSKGALTLNLSDVIDGYKRVMKSYGIDTVNETHYYAMIIKLSLNQQGKTWRDCLNIEKMLIFNHLVTLCL